MPASSAPRLATPAVVPPSPAGDPIVLPPPEAPPPRAPSPVVASLVPMVASVAIWAVTGSLMALCFAALGPLMAVASLVDRARGGRRRRREAQRENAEALRRANEQIDRRHEAERATRWRESPDAATLLADPRRQWRCTGTEMVVGRGAVPSAVRVTGGEGEVAAEVRRRAGMLDDAPVTVPLSAGVAVQGDAVVAAAVARALVLQLALSRPPGELAMVAAPEREQGWATTMPHWAPGAGLRAGTGAGGGSTRVALVEGDPATIATTAADVVVAIVAPGADVPSSCGALLEVDGVARGRVLWGGAAIDVQAEGLSAPQAEAIARRLTARAVPAGAADGTVLLGELRGPSTGEPLGALGCAIGREGAETAVVDLVADGPHAVVVGMTGSGKSELLLTWVTALAGSLPPDRVQFLLADFKGGTAFAALGELPHVSGVITDLDGGGARRAVESLRAEIRRREIALGAVGARDVSDPRAELPRLVIVVDEFAAMLQEHPDLHAVFTDVAARGRALGLHLVLGTQRAGGVLRDALVANCPLRIGLRMTEPAESRALLGEDGAAALPGGADGRGLAWIRRAGDAAPRLTRVALSQPADVAAARERFVGRARPPAPWLPPLPTQLSRGEVAALAGDVMPEGAVLLGLADDPARQRRLPVVLTPGVDRGLVVVGAGGTGRSSVAALVGGAPGEAIVVPRDAEAAWDALELADRTRPRLLVIDDVDAVLVRYPAEYAQAAAERIEEIVRDAGESGTTVVLTAARLSGAVLRVADLLPRRALLALPGRAEHAAAGGDVATFDPSRPPGRAVLDGLEVQFALPDAPAAPAEPASPRTWAPTDAVTGMVLRAARRRAEQLAAAWGDGVRLVPLDALPSGARLDALAGAAERVVLAGDGDAWQRQWSLLQDVRASAPFVVGADCATELRTLLGERDLPPYARTRASRAWLLRDTQPPERVLLP
ncbi:FtsK/SpoIIIE domain-containing protein [Microbacterium marinilacus]|uniref:FtsK domain-containing protein n=1 Tax=Microbacterium marinilacus TaxID=415209 RepID=A0ABP7B132_9MICO|nr:FtsK/SpoIIIE domain-containing protein [Microbacterium marinilacus]MBY0690089.1 cell division protein FtsK [Microbacterium marinilacus]